MKKLIMLCSLMVTINMLSWACPSINMQLTAGVYDMENNTQVQLFKISDELGNSVVVSTQFGNVNNQIGIQAKGCYKGGTNDLTNPCGPIFQDDMCYRIEALHQENSASLAIKFNSSQAWNSLTINYHQGVFTLQGGNPATYTLNTCRFCQHDLTLGPDVSYANPLTECDSWIVSNQELAIQPTTTVVWDANPANGYIDLNPGFTSAPTTHCFLAQLEDGCGPRNPIEKRWYSKLILQGLWNGSQMTPALMNQGIGTSAQASDWVNIEWRASSPPYTSLAHSAGLLSVDGWVETPLNPSLTANYYLVIKHRNTLETWSANPISMSSDSMYDFTTAATQAYGSNTIQVGNGVYALYTGDLNQDGFIDAFDYPALDADTFNGLASIYVATDLNGDGFVDSFDFPLFDVNSQNNVSIVSP